MKSLSFYYHKLFFLCLLVFFSSCNGIATELQAQETGSFRDSRDGKVYQSIKIGELWIMSENFAYKPDNGKYWAYNNDTNYVAKYGYLYDWETAKKVTPKGWHLPSRTEFKMIRKSFGGKWDLVKYLGGTMEIVYSRMIKKDGLNVKFGGTCNQKGQFWNINLTTDFWSSTIGGYFDNGPFYYRIDSRDTTAYQGSVDSEYDGKSVRFIKDY